MNTPTNKKYQLIAINEDTTTCEQCGKTHLQRVMWIKEVGKEGDPFPVGTTCGAKLLKLTTSKINTIVKNFPYDIDRQKRVAFECHPLYSTIRHLQDSWIEEFYRLERTNPNLKIMENPNKEKIDELKAQIRADVEAMEFSVAL